MRRCALDPEQFSGYLRAAFQKRSKRLRKITPMAVNKDRIVSPPAPTTLGTTVDYSEVSATPTSNWLEENQKLVVTVVAVVLAIGALAFLYRKFIQEPARAEAAGELWRAQQLFEADSFQIALTGRPGSVTGFLDVIDNYGNTPSGNLAKYYAGVSYLQLGQYEAAISYLSDFDADGDLLPATTAGALGDAYAQTGDMEKAESYYKKALDESDKQELLAPYYLKKLALFHEVNSDKAAANALYVRIRDEFPDSEEAGDITKFITRSAGGQ